MNKKTRKSEVIAQLGDPLPLPYKPNIVGGKIKDEPLEDWSEERIEPIRNFNDNVLRRRQVLAVSQRGNERDIHDIPETFLRLPIWRRSHSPGYNPVSDGDILDQIERNLHQLRSVDHDDGDKLTLERVNAQVEELLQRRHERSLLYELERQQQHLQQLQQREQREQRQLLELLNDYQHQSENQREHEMEHLIANQREHQIKNKQHQLTLTLPLPLVSTWIALVTILVLLLAVISMLLGNMSYEYCYYVC